MALYLFDRVSKVGKWTVQIDTNEQYGFFEHDDYGEGGGLWLVDNALEDFDGVFELPSEVIEAIENCGFNADYAKG